MESPIGLKEWLAMPENQKKRLEAIAKNKAVREARSMAKKEMEVKPEPTPVKKKKLVRKPKPAEALAVDKPEVPSMAEPKLKVDEIAYAKQLREISEAEESSRKGILTSLAKERLRKAVVERADVNINKKEPMTKLLKMFDDTEADKYLSKATLKRLINLIPRDTDIAISVFGDRKFCVVLMQGYGDSKFMKAILAVNQYAYKDEGAMGLQSFVGTLAYNYRRSGGLTDTGKARVMVETIIENKLLKPEEIGNLASYVNNPRNDVWWLSNREKEKDTSYMF